MFWGCFSYDKKGPFYIWEKETPKEKTALETAIKKLNAELEPQLRAEWEEAQELRLSLRKKRGKKLEWNFNTKTGKLTRTGKGGIDWWQYRETILRPKLIPFAQECQKERPKTLI